MTEVRSLPERHGYSIVWATDDGPVPVPVERIASEIGAEHLAGYVAGLADGRGSPIVYMSEPHKFERSLVEYDETKVWWEVRAAFVPHRQSPAVDSESC